MGAPAGTKPVGVRGEAWIEQLAQYLMHCLLDETVENGGDGTRKLHRITASLRDVLKSLILSTPFEVRAFKS